jgi:hypothetical protein
MIQLGSIVNSPEFAQAFTILRSVGSFDYNGRWIEGTPIEIPTKGTIVPVQGIALQALAAEADRVSGAMDFYSQTPMYITRGEGDLGLTIPATSDRILWHGSYYRLKSVSDLSNFGFYRATGIRTAGN